MFDMKKPISEYSTEEIAEAARFIRNLPKKKRDLIVRRLVAMRERESRSLFAQARLDGKFGFRGIIYAGDVCGR